MRDATLDDSTLSIVGGVYSNRYDLPAGTALIQHRHKYDHPAVLAKGAAQVTVDGVSVRYDAPALITIAAGKHHGVVALTDATWFCLHNEAAALMAHDMAEAQSVAETLGLSL